MERSENWRATEMIWAWCWRPVEGKNNNDISGRINEELEKGGTSWEGIMETTMDRNK